MKSKAKKRWSLEAGRGLLLNGKPVLYFSIPQGVPLRAGGSQRGWALLPWQADRLSHRIVAALNAADRQRRDAARSKRVATFHCGEGNIK